VENRNLEEKIADAFARVEERKGSPSRDDGEPAVTRVL
jgi:hypothetical protein